MSLRIDPGVIHREIYKNIDIQIVSDDDPPNPRKDWENLGTLCTWRNVGPCRANLGDESPLWDIDDHRRQIAFADSRMTWTKDYDAITDEEVDLYYEQGNAIMLPVFIYDHGSVSLQTTPFSCKWDSAQVGYIHVYWDVAVEEYKWKPAAQLEFNFICGQKENRTNDEIWECAEKMLVSEIDIYDEYLNGNCSGFILSEYEADGDEILATDHLISTFGFLGYSLETMKKLARREADRFAGVPYDSSINLHPAGKQKTRTIRRVGT